MVNDTANVIVGAILWLGCMILMIMAMRAIRRSSRGQVKPSTRRERLDREIGISKNSEMISQAKISCFGSIIHFFLFTFFLVLFLMTLFGGGVMLIESIIEILG